jgi:membrane protease YdiL (CAAX protease family)
MDRETVRSSPIIQFAVFFEAGICLFAAVLGWLLNVPALSRIHPTWTSLISGVLATGPLLFAMWWCSNSSLKPLQKLMNQVEESLVPVFLGASSGTLLLISVLAGLGEELLFRGVFQIGLAAWVGLPIALAATSTLFGLAHLITPTYAVLAGLIGVYFGVLAVATDSLFAPIVAHAFYDWVALMYLVSPRRRKDT